MTHHILVISNFLQKPIAEVAYKIVNAIDNFNSYRRREAEIRQAIRELSSMSDKDLDDIGINRYDIPFIARGEYH